MSSQSQMSADVASQRNGNAAPSAALTDLIARVEKLERSKFEVERALFEAFCVPEECFGSKVVGFFRSGATYGFKTEDGFSHHDCVKVPPFTASLDAALALVERVLPDWNVTINRIREDEDGEAASGASARVWRRRRWGSAGQSAVADTPALAIILALLRALASQAETK